MGQILPRIRKRDRKRSPALQLYLMRSTASRLRAVRDRVRAAMDKDRGRDSRTADRDEIPR
jgi:hypothetical protein